MILIAIILGCVIGALIGINLPMISYTYSGYLAIAIIAALDSVFGGITSTLKKNFDLTPEGIINYLNLREPIYTKTTNYGHFGKEGLSYENIIKL